MDAVHSNETCPWHEKGEQPSEPPEMDSQADDEDVAAGTVLQPMSANSGKKLGVNLGGKDNTDILVSYPGSAQPKPEKLQWAPHHLIPGNASLKYSKIVPYLGCDTVIKPFGSGSKIKDKQTVGYDVNSAQNGVFLPSPYALSMKGKWPTTQPAKLAYVVAAIDQNGGNLQFHMTHTQYSAHVQSILDTLADKLRLLTTSGKCPEADAKKDDKFNAPQGLVGRLNAISNQMKQLLTGPVWRAPVFTDDTQMPAYVANKNMQVVKGLKGDVVPVQVGSL